jgi:hypothetical protein
MREGELEIVRGIGMKPWRGFALRPIEISVGRALEHVTKLAKEFLLVEA